MVQTTKDLIDRGEIVMTSGDGAGEMVVITSPAVRPPPVRAGSSPTTAPTAAYHKTQVAAGITLSGSCANSENVACSDGRPAAPRCWRWSRESCAHRKAPPDPAPS